LLLLAAADLLSFSAFLVLALGLVLLVLRLLTTLLLEQEAVVALELVAPVHRAVAAAQEVFVLEQDCLLRLELITQLL
jgi:hypothetical protein